MTARSFIQKCICTIPITAVIILTVAVISSNHLVSTGHLVHKMDSVIDILEDENELLRQKVASASAISTIRTKAEALGMVQAQNVISFTADDFSVAFAPKYGPARE